jgi:fatty-acyl-CoA synthase
MASASAADRDRPVREQDHVPRICTAWLDALDAARVPTPFTAGPEDMALLPYTSGTTGAAKACIHTHASLMHNTIAGALWPRMTAESRSLAVAPMFHITGLVFGVLTNVYLGATAHIMLRWDRERAAGLIETQRLTHFVCIPTMVIDLLASPNCGSFDLRSLHNLIGGGTAMPEAVARRLQDEFGLTFVEGYGLTETAAIVHCNPIARAKPQCLGIPVFGHDSRVVDPETGRELAPGRVGELVIHGQSLFKGYWRQPEATAAAFVEIDGRPFFRTGDLVYADDEGYFFIQDRRKRIINSSGYKVSPAEVEAMLYRHPAIQEACVVGAPDEYRGEIVKAIVVVKPDRKADFSAAGLVAWARGQMAVYKAPRTVQVVANLPKSASGKVLWKVLQDAQRAGAEAAGRADAGSGYIAGRAER